MGDKQDTRFSFYRTNTTPTDDPDIVICNSCEKEIKNHSFHLAGHYKGAECSNPPPEFRVSAADRFILNQENSSFRERLRSQRQTRPATQDLEQNQQYSGGRPGLQQEGTPAATQQTKRRMPIRSRKATATITTQTDEPAKEEDNTTMPPQENDAHGFPGPESLMGNPQKSLLCEEEKSLPTQETFATPTSETEGLTGVQIFKNGRVDLTLDTITKKISHTAISFLECQQDRNSGKTEQPATTTAAAAAIAHREPEKSNTMVDPPVHQRRDSISGPTIYLSSDSEDEISFAALAPRVKAADATAQCDLREETLVKPPEPQECDPIHIINKENTAPARCVVAAAAPAQLGQCQQQIISSVVLPKVKVRQAPQAMQHNRQQARLYQANQAVLAQQQRPAINVIIEGNCNNPTINIFPALPSGGLAPTLQQCDRPVLQAVAGQRPNVNQDRRGVR